MGCLCGLPNFACPYHLAKEHLAWLKSRPHYRHGVDAPLSPTLVGLHPGKTTVVDTYEHLGSVLGQPLTSEAGLRLFGGHTPQVTGGTNVRGYGNRS